MTAKRKIIVHYHIFKNAGTSVDRMLRESFGERWASWDTDNPSGKISPAEMEEYILAHPDILALSSHQAVPPLPDRYLEVYPIVFLRHPIDRAYSAYLFEWQKQQGGSKPIGSFDDYVAVKFKGPRRNAIEDFQAMHLANTDYDKRAPAKNLDDEEILGSARQLLLSLPFFGLVEDYAGSLQRMKQAFAAAFPELNFAVHHENVLQGADLSLVDKLRRIREEMDPDAYRQLVFRNQLDLRLYEFATAYVMLQQGTD